MTTRQWQDTQKATDSIYETYLDLRAAVITINTYVHDYCTPTLELETKPLALANLQAMLREASEYADIIAKECRDASSTIWSPS